MYSGLPILIFFARAKDPNLNFEAVQKTTSKVRCDKLLRTLNIGQNRKICKFLFITSSRSGSCFKTWKKQLRLHEHKTYGSFQLWLASPSLIEPRFIFAT